VWNKLTETGAPTRVYMLRWRQLYQEELSSKVRLGFQHRTDVTQFGCYQKEGFVHIVESRTVDFCINLLAPVPTLERQHLHTGQSVSFRSRNSTSYGGTLDHFTNKTVFAGNGERVCRYAKDDGLAIASSTNRRIRNPSMDMDNTFLTSRPGSGSGPLLSAENAATSASTWPLQSWEKRGKRCCW
jgi:hypothetical protein